MQGYPLKASGGCRAAHYVYGFARTPPLSSYPLRCARASEPCRCRAAVRDTGCRDARARAAVFAAGRRRRELRAARSGTRRVALAAAGDGRRGFGCARFFRCPGGEPALEGAVLTSLPRVLASCRRAVPLHKGSAALGTRIMPADIPGYTEGPLAYGPPAADSESRRRAHGSIERQAAAPICECTANPFELDSVVARLQQVAGLTPVVLQSVPWLRCTLQPEYAAALVFVMSTNSLT